MTTSFTEAHSPVIAAFRDAGASPAALKDIQKILVDHVHVNIDGVATIVEKNGSPALDPDNGYQPHSPQSFVNSLRRSRPNLFDGHTAPAKVPDPEPSAAPAPARAVTMTEAMSAYARGDTSLLQEFEKQNGRAPKIASKQPSFTDMMLAARRGDPDALAVLESHMKSVGY